jgi:hypothetical protein
MNGGKEETEKKGGRGKGRDTFIAIAISRVSHVSELVYQRQPRTQ